jgi:hypothetical protein
VAKSRNALLSVDDAVLNTFGMQPNMNRLSLLPYKDQKEGWIAPNALYQMARAMVSPGVAAQGGYVSEEDAINFGGNLVGAGIGASAAIPARSGVLGMNGGAPTRVIRPKGWQAAVDNVDELSQPGHLYRGMTKEEYEATVNAGLGVKSRGDYSHATEGTNFAGKFSEAESYANYGRSDPRKTGKPNYVVEVVGDGIQQAKDGYYKTSGVDQDRITRVWELFDQDGEVVARQVR